MVASFVLATATALHLCRDASALSGQHQFTMQSAASQQLQQASCLPLNLLKERCFVKVGLGTPPQMFELVFDTGSTAAVLNGCGCAGCRPEDRCFESTKSHSYEGGLKHYKITYGSGPVHAHAITDVLHIGTNAVRLQDSVLVLTRRENLHVAGHFEGIMGFGPKPWRGGHTFLQDGHIKSFSVCFGGTGYEGAVRLDVPRLPEANLMDVIPGTSHWTLRLSEMSWAGTKSTSVRCSADGNGPCEAVFDTGTTAIMGPIAQIKSLFEDGCSAWPRCSRLSKKFPHVQKAILFVRLVRSCTSWMTQPAGLAEMPKLHFEVMSGSKKETLSLSPSSYVAEMTVQDYRAYALPGLEELAHNETEPLDDEDLAEGGDDDVPQVSKPQRRTDVVLFCSPLFGRHSDLVHAQTGGDLWLFGTPVFHEYDVYHEVTPRPALSFSKTPCGSCKAAASAPAGAGLYFATGSGDGSREPPSPWPRRVSGPWVRDADVAESDLQPEIS